MNDVLTDLDERRERPCVEALPVFRLKASDVTSELLVDLWILCQIRLAQELKRGYTPECAVENIRTYFGVPKYPAALFPPEQAKLKGAAEVAEAFRNVPHRKVAD